MNTLDSNKVLRWAKGIVPLCLLAFLPLMTSCSEADEENEEWANWQERNETFFEQQYQTHANATATRYILPSWSMPASRALSDVPHTSCILVDVIESGIGTTSPYFTDSVAINYSGRLMPSEHYTLGYEFDRSYLSEYDPDVDVPGRFAVSGVVEGFATALQKMHRGDRWRVIVPYQLGYGTADQTSIPGYSTLVFEIELLDFWTEEQGDRD